MRQVDQSIHPPFRLGPAPRDCGFELPDYWVWCGSVIRDTAEGGDGHYHLFASRWPKFLSFSPHWVTNSEIIRASSDSPAGPYQFEEIVLRPRAFSYFDSRVTHNPRVVSFDGVYYLYYVGTTYDFPTPDAEHQLSRSSSSDEHLYERAWTNKRIGLATSFSVKGPWRRIDQPLLEPRPGKWDALITTNPSVAVRGDGFTVMIYKSCRAWGGPLQLGLATAPHPAGPFTAVSDEAAFPINCEDPFLWLEDDRYHVIFKDFSGELCGVPYGGAYAWSDDLVEWHASGKAALAYSRNIEWADGRVSTHGSLERPSLVIENGRPTHFVAAGSADERKMWETDHTRVFVIPLTQY